jgi:acyl-CoA reductase LuxC
MPKTSSARNTALRTIPARSIVRAIAGAAERWSDADFPPRVRASAAIQARLGYTLPVVDYALDRLFSGITAGALTATANGELGSLAALDDFTTVAGRPAAWARGVDAVTIVSSDSTIGVAIVPLVFALLAKCAVIVKDRSDALVAAFAETLGEELPELRSALDVRAWTGGDDAAEAKALGTADVVVAFGGSAALRAIRAQCSADATFVPFGHRASAGYISSAALAADDLAALAMDVARDALLYDGEGCLSLHLLFVQRASDGAHERFPALLADACAATAIEFPPGPRSPERAAQTHAYTSAAAFRAANGSGRVLRAPDGAWSVVVAPPAEDLPPFGGGVIPVFYVNAIDEIAAIVAQHAIPLQAVGAASGADARALARELGAVRIARLGAMQDPPVAGHHGGRPRIADFVRWVDRA